MLREDAFWRGAHPVCRGVIGVGGGGDVFWRGVHPVCRGVIGVGGDGDDGQL